MIEEEKEILIKFLKECNQYSVLHEASISDNNKEHYFIFIGTQDSKNDKINILLQNYECKYPILDVSDATKKYMNEKRKYFYFLYIDTLDKKDIFFQENERLLKENISNIISLRIIGEAVDMPTHLEAHAVKYFSQIKEISLSLGSVLKDELNEKIKPMVANKFQEIKKKIFKE